MASDGSEGGSGGGDVRSGGADNICGKDNVGSEGDVGGAALADEGNVALADVGDTALVDMGDIALADVGSAGYIGSKGDRGSTAPMCFGGLIVIPLICTARLAQLLKQ